MHYNFSSHFNSRPHGSYIDTVIVHSMCVLSASNPLDAAACIKLLDELKLSAHYIIDRQGVTYQLVKDSERAWHAGVSKLPFDNDARENVNNFSIGVELLAMPEGTFEESQYQALNSLIAEISTKNPLRYILGHQHIAPTRKQDPGAGFDWKKVREFFKDRGFVYGDQ